MTSGKGELFNRSYTANWIEGVRAALRMLRRRGRWRCRGTCVSSSRFVGSRRYYVKETREGLANEEGRETRRVVTLSFTRRLIVKIIIFF